MLMPMPPSELSNLSLALNSQTRRRDAVGCMGYIPAGAVVWVNNRPIARAAEATRQVPTYGWDIRAQFRVLFLWGELGDSSRFSYPTNPTSFWWPRPPTLVLLVSGGGGVNRKTSPATIFRELLSTGCELRRMTSALAARTRKAKGSAASAR